MESSKASKCCKGALVVLGVGISSMASTQAAKAVYSETFNGTCFVTFATAKFNLLIFPLFMIVHKLFRLSPRGGTNLMKHCMEPFQKSLDEPKSKVFLRMFLVMIPFTFLWLFAIYTYIKSLSYLMSTDVSTLFSSSNIFVFIFSLLILKEKFYFTKMLAVLIGVSGVVVFYYAENELQTGEKTGIVIALVTSLLSASYKVLYKKIIKEGTVAQVLFSLTIIGVISLLFFWPFILIFHYTGFEKISGTGVIIPWKSLAMRGSFALIMNFFINFGIAYTSSLLVSIGGALAIPLNAIVDTVWHKYLPDKLKALGSVMIVSSFLVLLIPNNILNRIEFCWKKSQTSANRTQQNINLDDTKQEQVQQ